MLLPLPLPLPLPLRRRLLLLLTLLRPTLQVGVDNSHVDEELLVEVSSGAAAPALLPPLGGRVQFLDSKQLGAAPYLVVHGDHMPRPPFVPVRLFFPALNPLCRHSLH